MYQNNDRKIFHNGTLAPYSKRLQSERLDVLKQHLDDRVAIYNELQEKFGVLLSHPAIWAYIEEVRRTLGLFPDVSDAKVLDSLLWALYAVTKKEKGALKN